MGTASRCAKRNPKVSELDEIGVRCIGPSVPFRQRICTRGRNLGSSQCLIAISVIGTIGQRPSTSAIGQQVGFSHESRQKYRKITVNAAGSARKSGYDCVTPPDLKSVGEIIVSEKRRFPWEQRRLRTVCQPSTLGCFDHRRTAGSLKCTG